MDKVVIAHRDNERGIALIAVLGALTALSLLAISVTGAARTSIDGAARQLARTQADSAVDSAVNLAIQQLTAAQAALPPVVAGPQTFRIGGYDVVVSARSESGKVDLNFADVALLMGMFREAGADPDQASALASAVMDWRDADDLLHVNGAELKEYQAARRVYGPANRLFESVDELRLVLGVSAGVFSCLRPDLTVFAQRANVDLATASPLVRRAMGMGTEGAGPAPGISPSVVSGQALGAGEVFEIAAQIDGKTIRRALRVVVRMTGNRKEPFWVLSSEPRRPMIDAATRHCPSPSDEGPGAR